MKQFFVFVQKEMYHILRDYRTMLVLFGMPIVQILLFGFALSTEVKESNLAVYDQAGDVVSQQLIHEFQESKYFEIKSNIYSPNKVEEVLLSGDIKMVMILPAHMEHDLAHENEITIQLITDATDPNVANTLVNYANGIIRDYRERRYPNIKLPYEIEVESRMLYNPQLIGAYVFVPGVIALVLMLVCTMMTSVAIVKEKELGTMEILLVSPMRKLTFIYSKAVPYLFLSLLIVSIILLLSVYVLDVPIKGSLGLLFAESTLYIITCLSLGLMISNFTNSQQVAMLVSLIGLMLPTIMLSGFMFPVENMPVPLQVISNIVPAKWFFYITKSIMVKGLGFFAIWKETLVLVGFSLVLMLASISKFKIRLA